MMERKMTPQKPSDREAQSSTKRKEFNLADLEPENLERIEQVWAERAIQLAKVDAVENSGDQETVVLIRLGNELLGLDVKFVVDIRPREVITRVPRVPGWVVGVTNLRGNILSVIHLSKYFGLPGDTADKDGGHSGLLVVVQAHTGDQNGAMEIVFLVDDVIGVETIPVRQGAAASGMMNSLRQEFVQFIGERKIISEAAGSAFAQRHVIILNLENLLSDPRLIVHEEIS